MKELNFEDLFTFKKEELGFETKFRKLKDNYEMNLEEYELTKDENYLIKSKQSLIKINNLIDYRLNEEFEKEASFMNEFGFFDYICEMDNELIEDLSKRRKSINDEFSEIFKTIEDKSLFDCLDNQGFLLFDVKNFKIKKVKLGFKKD